MHVGKYQLVSKLATGGMAEVYLAKSAGPMGFEKTLVLKRILPHLAEDEQFVEMFLGEAKLAAQLEHPNIVQIFDFGEAEGTYYLAMEYIDGPNLRVLAKRARAAGALLPIALCAKIIASACEGLAFAHDFTDKTTGEPLELIHRDISPDNILLSRQGAVKVVDFGIAKAANQSHKTQSGVIKGKVAYMPPEQLQARPLDRRVDVYALGVVLYELLTGHKPFDATTDVSMMQAIMFEPFVPAGSRRPDLPRALVRILDRALSKVREHRYPDCRAFQAELEHFILSTGESVGAYQLSRLVAQVSGDDNAGHVVPPGPGSATPYPSDVTRVARPESNTNAADLAPPTLVSSSRPAVALSEVEESVTPRRRTGWWGALAGLVLLTMGGGFLLFHGGDSVPRGPPSPAVTMTAPQRAPTSPPASSTIPARRNPPDTQPPLTPQPAEVQLPSPPKVTRAVRTMAARKTAGEERVAQPEPGGQESPSPVATADNAGTATDTAEDATETQSQPSSVEKGAVEFRVRPYATVFLDGRQLGRTPVAPAEVEAGEHTVRLINRELGKDVARTIEVRAGQSLIFKHNLLEE